MCVCVCMCVCMCVRQKDGKGPPIITRTVCIIILVPLATTLLM